MAYQEDYTKEVALHLGLGGEESLGRLKARWSAGINIPEYLPPFRLQNVSTMRVRAFVLFTL